MRQVYIIRGGTGTPGPLVSIPGVYKSGGPGFILTQSTTPTSHSPPGPEARVGEVGEVTRIIPKFEARVLARWELLLSESICGRVLDLVAK
jgi:hypothetical protein